MSEAVDAAALRYSEVAPPAHLAPWIACIWSMRGESLPASHRVLPDGCIDVVIDASGVDVETRVVGPMRTAAVVPMAGRVDVLGVRFRPGGHVLLAPFAADVLLDLDADPRDLLPRAPLRRALVAAPWRELSSAAREASLWAALGDATLTARDREPLLLALLHAWRTPGPGVARVRDLADAAGVSERTLERRVRAAAGLGPAELRRLVRFRHALRLRDVGGRDWTALALDAGYADQPHLAREFRRFAGLTPGAWDEERRVGFVQDGTVRAL